MKTLWKLLPLYILILLFASGCSRTWSGIKHDTSEVYHDTKEVIHEATA